MEKNPSPQQKQTQIEIKSDLQDRMFIDKFRIPLQETEIIKNIGKRQSTLQKIDEYKNPQIRSKLQKFKEKCPEYRPIRGDGNCFYRSMIFGLLEHYFSEYLISLQQKNEQKEQIIIQKLFNLIENTEKIKLSNFKKIPEKLFLDYISQKPSHFLKQMIRQIIYYILSEIKQKQSTINLNNFLYQIFNEFIVFDFALILLTRTLTFQAFNENEILQFIYPEKTDYENEKNRIITYGEEAMNSSLDMTYNALKINVITHQVDKNVYTSMESGTEKPELTLNLFFRPGHYDLCYTENTNIPYEKPQQIQEVLSTIDQESNIQEINPTLLKKTHFKKQYSNPQQTTPNPNDNQQNENILESKYESSILKMPTIKYHKNNPISIKNNYSSCIQDKTQENPQKNQTHSTVQLITHSQIADKLSSEKHFKTRIIAQSKPQEPQETENIQNQGPKSPIQPKIEDNEKSLPIVDIQKEQISQENQKPQNTEFGYESLHNFEKIPRNTINNNNNNINIDNNNEHDSNNDKKC